MPKSIGFGTARLGWATVFAVVIVVMLGLLFAAKPAQAKTFTVTFTTDGSDVNPGDGTCDASPSIVILCTLRAAIQEANALAGADAIHFNISGRGVQTIEPYEELPLVTEQVTIDGYTQPGATENTIKKGATNAKLLIEINGENTEAWASGLSINDPSSVVRGLVINRFALAGIVLFAGANGASVEGNFLGTDPSGTLDRGNASRGMYSTNSGNHTIGGDSPAARNLISGNGEGGSGCGVQAYVNSLDLEVTGNLIGTQKNGISPLGEQGYGVCMDADGSLGGNFDVTHNTIAFNDDEGVRVFPSSDENSILSNSIHSNGGIGIDLFGGSEDPAGNTTNDPKDPDTGANRLQNKPVLTSAETLGTKTTIEGKLNSKPSKGFIIQFFSNPVGDEGEKFVGEKYVTTNASGNASFSFIVPKLTVPDGQTVTATATGREGSSEFSAPKSVT